MKGKKLGRKQKNKGDKREKTKEIRKKTEGEEKGDRLGLRMISKSRRLARLCL